MSYKQTPIIFDPNNLPEVATPVMDIDGNRIGTFNPHTLIIHPVEGSQFGPMKLLGRMVFDMRGGLVGKFTPTGHFEASA